MLSWAAPVQIYLARGTTDLRRSVDGLAGLVRNAMERDPFSGHLFVFCNRRRDRVKILVFESSGFWVLYKRLEKGTFAWPDGEGGSVSKSVSRYRIRTLEISEPAPTLGACRSAP